MSSRPTKALTETWNKKLKDSGFEDAEDSKGNLKQFHGSKLFSRSRAYVTMESQTEYYRQAGQFLHEYTGFTPITKKIWELHSIGKSVRQIVKIILIYEKSYVFKLIDNMATIMLNQPKEVQDANE